MANRPEIRTSDSALIAMIADEVRENHFQYPFPISGDCQVD